MGHDEDRMAANAVSSARRDNHAGVRSATVKDFERLEWIRDRLAEKEKEKEKEKGKKNEKHGKIRICQPRAELPVGGARSSNFASGAAWPSVGWASPP